MLDFRIRRFHHVSGGAHGQYGDSKKQILQVVSNIHSVR